LRSSKIRQIVAIEEEAKLVPPEPLVDGRDVIGLVGLAILCGGVAFIYWPAALIVLGAAILLIAWQS
jgi:hypothetical protein